MTPAPGAGRREAAPDRLAGTPPGTRAGLRTPLLVRQPLWAAGLAAVLAFAAVCVLLGSWQWSRMEAIDQRNAVLAANYDREPTGLEAVVADDGAVPPQREWTPVALTGRYDLDAGLLVRNRQQAGRNGYLVVAPLVLDERVRGRDAVWVVQGWVAGTAVDSDADGTAAVAVAAESVPAGPVQVVARVRPAEPDGDRRAPPGQVQRLAGAELAAAARLDAGVAVDGYAVLAADAGTASPSAAAVAGAGPEPVPRPEPDPGPHLAYALQWWVFAAGGLGIWAAFYRRSAREAAPAAPAADPSAAAPAAGSAAGRSRRTGSPRRRPARDPWRYQPGG